MMVTMLLLKLVMLNLILVGTTDCMNATSSEPDIPTNQSESSLLVNILVGGIIGGAGIIFLGLLCFCGVIYCFIGADQVADLDTVEYYIQEEYAAKINFEALDNLEPSIRARIDMDLLAKLTNTDPSLLTKYKAMNKESDYPQAQSPTSHCYGSPSSHKSLKLHSVEESEGLKRSTTMSDMNLNSSISSITMRKSICGSQPMTIIVQREGGSAEKAENVELDLLRVFTVSTTNSSRIGSGAEMEVTKSRENSEEEADEAMRVELEKEAREEIAMVEIDSDDSGVEQLTQN